MEGNAGEVEEFSAFWSAVPGVDQVRIKEDETNLMRPDAGHAAGGLEAPLPLPVARADVREAERRRIPVLPELLLDGAPLGNLAGQSLAAIWNSRGHGGDAPAACRRAGRRSGRVLALLHHHSASGAGGRQPAAPWPTVRRLLPAVERLAYLSKLPARLLRPPRRLGGAGGTGPAQNP